MSVFHTRAIRDFSVSDLSRMMPVVDTDVTFGSDSFPWSEDDQSLLIDTILNGMQMPTIYLRTLTESKKNPRGLSYQYSIIDGKQRIDAILKFANNELALSDTFTFIEDQYVEAGGMKLADLKDTYPELAARFWDYPLPVTRVRCISDNLINVMLNRLRIS